MSQMEKNLIEEFKALRQEIIFNFEGQIKLLIFATVGVGSILSFGHKANNSFVFLVGTLIVILCLAYTLALKWSTVRISAYVRCFIEPNVDGLNWETIMKQIRFDKVFGFHLLSFIHSLGYLIVYDSLALSCSYYSSAIGGLYPLLLNVALMIVIVCLNITILRATSKKVMVAFEENLKGKLPT